MQDIDTGPGEGNSGIMELHLFTERDDRTSVVLSAYLATLQRCPACVLDRGQLFGPWRASGGGAPTSAIFCRPRVQLVHAPTHASWLNQVEIYFSILQRKVLTPNDFPISTSSRNACWTSNTTGS